jgi:predicted O-methyltransferase YrrM
MAFDETYASVRDIDGWLTSEQARTLYERAAKLPKGARIVEIGSHHGRSTIVLAKAAPEAEVIAIDPYEEEELRPLDLERFMANLEEAGVRHRVQHLHDFSTRVLHHFEGEIDLLYIDGAHDLRTAVADIRGWPPLVRQGGSLFIHDSFSSLGVTLAELISLVFQRQFRYVGKSRTLAEYRREAVSGRDVPLNIGRQLSNWPWFARNVLVKVALVSGARPVARLLGHPDDVFPY